MKLFNPKIKICDISDAETAMFCANAGVDYLGLHAIWGIDNEKKERYRKIRKELMDREYSTKLVIVTRQQWIEILQKIIAETEIEIIQLHAKWDPDEVYALKNKLLGILSSCSIICVIEPGSASKRHIHELATVADYILFDSSYRGGTGRVIDNLPLQKSIDIVHNRRFFIAGGLNKKNVGKIISKFHPYGIDVQSAVEDNGRKGIKDRQKILDFIKSVKDAGVPADNLDEIKRTRE